jgi:hypothetical protein
MLFQLTQPTLTNVFQLLKRIKMNMWSNKWLHLRMANLLVWIRTQDIFVEAALQGQWPPMRLC